MRSFLKRIKAIFPSRSPVRLGWHFAQAFLAAAYNGFPARKLTVIGVTGTDGKTTTVAMMYHILREAGRSAGMISTTEFRIGDTIELNTTQKTSVHPKVLQRQIQRIVDAGCEFAVVEVSSHGLVQGRVHHIFPSVAAVTNVSPEHLDYHGTLEQYTKDKGKLFRMLKGRGAKILNGGDTSYHSYKNIRSADTIVYNASESDLWCSAVAARSDGSSAELHTDTGKLMSLELSIPGVFNLENAQCAIACCSAVGIPLQVSVEALKSFTGVSGRLEKIDEGQPFSVFIDFTVTSASYEKVLQTLRSMLPKGKRVLVLISSCGNRMIEKRPLIGKVCSDLADAIVVTSDETYGEPHEKIMNDICSGIDQSHPSVETVPDRKEAIACILKKAQAGDAVAICGMAGVTTMMTEKGQIPWDERKIVQNILRAMIF